VIAFLTGATGFIGSHVARALCERGEHVRCLVRPGSRRQDLVRLGLELFEGDVTDLPSLRAAADGADTVYHCAADYRLFAPDPREIYRNNVNGTDNVLRVAAEAGVAKVVYTSSVATLAPSRSGPPADEEARAELGDVVGDYKRSKLLAERVAERWCARGLPVVMVCPSTPVGEGDAKPTPTGQIIVDFLGGRLPAIVDTGLNVVDVRDVAAGHVLAAERGRTGQRYILGNVNLTLRQLLEILGRLSGRRAPRLSLPHWIPLAIAHVEAPIARWRRRAPRVPLDGVRMAKGRMFFDGAKAVRELGVPQSPIEPALERAVRWFVDHDYMSEVKRPS